MAAVVGTSREEDVMRGGGVAGVSVAEDWFAALTGGFGVSAMRRPLFGRGRGFGLLTAFVGASDGAVAAGPSSSTGGRASGGGMIALRGIVGAGTIGCGFGWR